MKILKPLMFAVAGFAIAFLVAFKNEEPKKEYSRCYHMGKEKYAIDFGRGELKLFTLTENESILKIVNSMGEDGWKLISVDQGCYYLERTNP